ncbi:NRDE family protein [Pseudalkalibacillus sp. SCS-8]|uniref:NRDE family protein n=1 Tax=Pseudalkalibacillus nanhaiensis TaxID=3115291 RepID=UPI0032DA4DF5
MCVLFFAFKVHDDYPLIVAANRDEFYERPTAPLHFWEDDPSILAGRDLKEMGTWMGISKQGRFAALTNFRDPSESTENKRSRGELVSDFLQNGEEPLEFLKQKQLERHEYRGYNLIVGNSEVLFYYSNVQNEIRKLQRGIYGLSNHFLDTPWPKVMKGKEDMERCLSGTTVIDQECLFNILDNRDPAEQHRLPDTGIGLEWEKKLSPIFIETEKYGTRSSTVLTVKSDRHVNVTERSVKDNHLNTERFTFRIE